MVVWATAPIVAQAQVLQLSASVDRNAVLLDESIVLNLVAQGSASRDALDFTALQTDFRTSQPSFSQSTQIINGSMSRTVTWSINLYPKQTGTFTIPSFTIDGQSSNQFTVRILPVDTASSEQPREFYVTSSIDNQVIYLQQQILYTVKIHLSRDIQRGQLTQPSLTGAIVEQIGEDQDYQEIIDGVRYRIIERKYAIIPQSSGQFTISGPMFEAEVPTNSRRSFANFGRSKNIARRAPDIDIDVRPIPDNYSDTWLPSELVELTEQWQGDTQPLQVGEPVTRTITLTALGLTKEQLPSISLPYHPSFKVYPEQAKLATVERNNRLIAQGVFNSAIIPEEAGNFVLPEVRIAWFNVNTGETQFASIPARSIEVVDKTDNIANTPQTQAPSNQALQVPPSDEEVAIDESHQSGSLQLLYFAVYALIATNILTLVAFYVFYLMKKSTTGNKKAVPATITRLPQQEDEAFKRVKDLVEQGKLTGVNEALENWLSIMFAQQYYSISASLATYPESNALEAYNSILASSFSAHSQQIDYKNVVACFTQFRKLALAHHKNSALAAMYPK
jgi:hypothetical protein